MFLSDKYEIRILNIFNFYEISCFEVWRSHSIQFCKGFFYIKGGYQILFVNFFGLVPPAQPEKFQFYFVN